MKNYTTFVRMRSIYNMVINLPLRKTELRIDVP